MPGASKTGAILFRCDQTWFGRSVKLSWKGLSLRRETVRRRSSYSNQNFNPRPVGKRIRVKGNLRFNPTCNPRTRPTERIFEEKVMELKRSKEGEKSLLVKTRMLWRRQKEKFLSRQEKSQFHRGNLKFTWESNYIPKQDVESSNGLLQ